MDPKLINGKWTVNGKKFSEMRFSERLLMNGFIKYKKKQFELKSKLKKLKQWRNTLYKFGTDTQVATKKTSLNKKFQPRP